jgi:hypothetical protein
LEGIHCFHIDIQQNKEYWINPKLLHKITKENLGIYPSNNQPVKFEVLMAVTVKILSAGMWYHVHLVDRYQRSALNIFLQKYRNLSIKTIHHYIPLDSNIHTLSSIPAEKKLWLICCHTLVHRGFQLVIVPQVFPTVTHGTGTGEDEYLTHPQFILDLATSATWKKNISDIKMRWNLRYSSRCKGWTLTSSLWELIMWNITGLKVSDLMVTWINR